MVLTLVGLKFDKCFRNISQGAPTPCTPTYASPSPAGASRPPWFAPHHYGFQPERLCALQSGKG